MKDYDEIVAIVDEANKIIGSETRSKMRKQGLKHRATYILVFNSIGELFVQKRTQTKDIYPGYYDVVTGGVVLKGEDYEESAYRELEEEMGITNTTLGLLFDFYFEEPRNCVWGRVYECVSDGPFILQKEEVESGDFYSVEEILKMSKFDPFTPDGLYVLQHYLNLSLTSSTQSPSDVNAIIEPSDDHLNSSTPSS